MIEKLPNELNDYYKKVFNSPWCPLFGVLPVIPQNLQYPSSIASRCLTVINKARFLCGINDNWINSFFPEDIENIDTIERETGFPKDIIRLGRAIFTRSETILFNAQFYTADGINGNSYVNGKFKVNSYQSDIYYIRNEVSITFKEYIDVQDFEILSILAICEAWSILEYIFCWDVKDDDPLIVKIMWEIELLLARATESKLLPYAKSGEKCINGGHEGAVKRWTKPDARKLQKKRNAEIEKAAKEVEKNNKNISANGIAQKVADQLKIPMETVRKSPPIKNLINQRKKNQKKV